MNTDNTSSSDQNAESSDMLTVFGTEKFRPIRRFGKTIPNYFISETGEPWSTKAVSTGKPLVPCGRADMKRNGNTPRDSNHPNWLKASKVYSAGAKAAPDGKPRKAYPRINCVLPHDWSDDRYEYHYNKTAKAPQITIDLHKAVMDTWRPIDEYPPDQLKETWNDVPEVWRQWVRDTVIIDHIDGDTWNSNVENLRYCTPRENNSFVKDQKYFGNTRKRDKLTGEYLNNTSDENHCDEDRQE